MGGPSVEYFAAIEHLKDGKWHDKEKALRRVMDAVPPGKARQHAERLRIQQLQKESRKEGPKSAQPRKRGAQSMDGQIRVGARAIARAVLNNKARFEVNGDQIRLLPEEARKERMSRKNTAKKSWETRLRAQGIDPATYKTKAQYNAEQRAIRATWTDIQWRDYRRELSRKSHATRQRRLKEGNASTEDLSGRGGPEQQGHSDSDAGVRPGGPHQRKGGDHSGTEEGRCQDPGPLR